MTNPINPDSPYGFVGPGMPSQFYLDQLAATGYTGWYDQHGVPAPWREHFCKAWRWLARIPVSRDSTTQLLGWPPHPLTRLPP
jgi:hypothetical protein